MMSSSNASDRVERLFLGIDAGGTWFKSALMYGDGRILTDAKKSAPSHSDGSSEDIVESYRELICKAVVRCENEGAVLSGVGISTPGPFDYEGGSSRMRHKFASIYGLPLRGMIRNATNLPETTPVRFVQDVHAFLMGECWTGAVQGVSNVVAITLGTGLGYGIMVEGRILTDGEGGPRYVVYDLPWEGGILEDRISRRGIIEAYRRLTRREEPGLDVDMIAERARASDMAAVEVFSETGRILGEGLLQHLSKHAITHILFGGQISKSFELFASSFAKAVGSGKGHLRPVKGADIDCSAVRGAVYTVR